MTRPTFGTIYYIYVCIYYLPMYIVGICSGRTMARPNNRLANRELTDLVYNQPINLHVSFIGAYPYSTSTVVPLHNPYIL